MFRFNSIVGVFSFLFISFPVMSWSSDAIDKYCQKMSPHELSNPHLRKVDKIIERFANKKGIAEQADQTLSKLLVKKSQFLLNWLQRNKINLQGQEEEVVRRWRVYYFKTYTMSQVGLSKLSDAQLKLMMGMLIEIQSALFPLQYQKYIESVFKKAKKVSLLTLDGFPMESKTREMLKQKIAQIKLFKISDINSRELFLAKSLQDFLGWTLSYDPVPNVINQGMNVLTYPNQETLFAVMAHEIGHAFDPCRFSALMTNYQNPFQKVLTCLREPAAAGAKNRDDSQMEKVIKAGRMSSDMAKVLKALPSCNKSFYPPKGVQKDQLNEVFADWFSAEVVANSKYLGKPGLRSDLCRNEAISKGSSYLENRERLDRVYFAQPKIKSSLKVKTSIKYCSF